MIDPRIPLMGQPANVLGAMAQGTELAGAQNALMRQGEAQNIFRQYGAGIAAGDQNALAKLAQFDPQAALGIRTTLNEDRRADARLGLAREDLQMRRDAVFRALAEAEDQQAALREAQEMEAYGRRLVAAYATGDQAAWQMGTMEAFGQPLPMDESGLAALGTTYQAAKDFLGTMPQAPTPNERYKTVGGQLVDLYAEAGPSPVPGIEGRSAGLSVTMPDGTVISQGGPAVMDRANLQAGSGETRVADPTSPTGTRILAEPGSRAEAERQAAESAAQAAATNDQNRSNVVLETTRVIRQMLDKGGDRGFLDLPEVGIVGERLARWGVNQEAVDMGGYIETLQGMVAFDRLEKMKAASATGASGLGQVTEREIALLAAQLGALKQDISDEALKRTLDTIESVFGRLSPQAQAYLTGATNNEPWLANSPSAPQPVRLRWNPATGDFE